MRIIGSGFLARNLAGLLGRRECRADGSRLVHLLTSSVGLYGRRGPVLSEDGPVLPCSPYGRHKLAIGHVAAIEGLRRDRSSLRDVPC